MRWSLVVMSVTVVTACGKSTGAPETTKQPELACENVFQPPAKSDLLCDEHVLGKGAEIHWRSFGVTQDRYPLFDPYLAAGSRCHLSFMFKPPILEVSDIGGDKGRRIEAFDASDTSYPTCAKGPSPSHKTVIILSEKFDRP